MRTRCLTLGLLSIKENLVTMMKPIWRILKISRQLSYECLVYGFSILQKRKLRLEEVIGLSQEGVALKPVCFPPYK